MAVFRSVWRAASEDQSRCDGRNMSDEEFRPKLGRIRAQGSKKGRKYLGRVLAATARSEPATGVRNRRFDGSRIGRGAATGRILASRDRHGGLRGRRAVVKIRLVRLGVRGCQRRPPIYAISSAMA